MMSLLARLVARGYKRPGLFIERGRDERTQRRLSAAARSLQERVPRIRSEEPGALVTARHQPREQRHHRSASAALRVLQSLSLDDVAARAAGGARLQAPRALHRTRSR